MRRNDWLNIGLSVFFLFCFSPTDIIIIFIYIIIFARLLFGIIG